MSVSTESKVNLINRSNKFCVIYAAKKSRESGCHNISAMCIGDEEVLI